MSGKNPVLVDAGRRGAEKRWGPPGTRTRVVKLGDLEAPYRRFVLGVIDLVDELAQEKAATDAA